MKHSLRHFVNVFVFGILFLSPKTQSLTAQDSLTVYVFLLDECRICQESAPELNEIFNKYRKKAGFTGVFPNFSSKPAGIESFTKRHGIGFRTRTDYAKKLVHRFNATVLPEVVVYNETSEKIIYRGAISDLYYAPGKRRQNPDKHYLRQALDEFYSNRPISVPETKPTGCFINKNDFIY